MTHAAEQTENTAELFPRSLSDVIRAKRGQAELRLSKTREIDALVGPVDPKAGIKDEIDNWRLVTFIDKASNDAKVLLIGDSMIKRHPAVTSPIASIDLVKGIALTRNQSVYKLGNRGYGEPSEDGLMFLCTAMHHWGTGAALGVPRF
jgi:hypothetical protein